MVLRLLSGLPIVCISDITDMARRVRSAPDPSVMLWWLDGTVKLTGTHHRIRRLSWQTQELPWLQELSFSTYS